MGSDVLVIQDTDSVDLMFNFSLRSYGKYTCKAFVLPNVTLEADTWLLPEGVLDPLLCVDLVDGVFESQCHFFQGKIQAWSRTCG